MLSTFFVTRWAFDTAVARADDAHLRAQMAGQREDVALERLAEAQRALEHSEVRNAELREIIRAKDQQYAGLVGELLDLKRVGFGALPDQDLSKSPLSHLGEKTRAALAEMGHGQSGAVKRAMLSSAIGLALEMKGDLDADNAVAEKVRRGELR